MIEIKHETVIAETTADIPNWIDANLMNGSDIEGIQYGGCASGAYMPAVTYCKAVEAMGEHGDDVLDYIQEVLGELPDINQQESWGGIAVFFLSVAVELWAGQFEVIDSMLV